MNVNVKRIPNMIDLYNYTHYALNIADKLVFIQHIGGFSYEIKKPDL